MNVFPTLAPWGMGHAAPMGRLYVTRYPLREWGEWGGRCVVRLRCIGTGPGPRNALVERMVCGEVCELMVRPFRGMRRVDVERQANLFGAQPQEVGDE